jgi:hypothetical protein
VLLTASVSTCKISSSNKADTNRTGEIINERSFRENKYGDVRSDIPVYTGARPAEDSGFGLTIQEDPSYPNAEWRFYETADAVEKVSEFYKTQMQSKGWTRESWADLGEMQYGSFQKNNETRRCLIYVIQSEDKTGINTLSTSK